MARAIRACFCLWLLFCVAESGEVFVSSDSSDGLGCGSMQDPCGSIQRGIVAACNSSASGATVWVEPGIYNLDTIDLDCVTSLKFVYT